MIWTDASSKIVSKGDEPSKTYEPVTTTAFVIKHGKSPPLIGSNVHHGIYNSTGELIAGIESLRALTDYCNCFGMNAKNYKVEMKTDFEYLKRVVDSAVVFSEDRRKRKLLKKFKKLQKEFKDVSCDEIQRSSNIAHNICTFKMKDFAYKENDRGLVRGFYEIYENPEENCVIKVS